MRTHHLILVSGLLAACGEAPPNPQTPEAVEGQLTLLFSSRLDGEIEPCG